jgi:hypothetical protein
MSREDHSGPGLDHEAVLVLLGEVSCGAGGRGVQSLRVIRGSAVVPSKESLGAGHNGVRISETNQRLSGGAKGSRTPDLLNAIQALMGRISLRSSLAFTL